MSTLLGFAFSPPTSTPTQNTKTGSLGDRSQVVTPTCGQFDQESERSGDTREIRGRYAPKKVGRYAGDTENASGDTREIRFREILEGFALSPPTSTPTQNTKTGSLGD